MRRRRKNVFVVDPEGEDEELDGVYSGNIDLLNQSKKQEEKHGDDDDLQWETAQMNKVHRVSVKQSNIVNGKPLLHVKGVEECLVERKLVRDQLLIDLKRLEENKMTVMCELEHMDMAECDRRIFELEHELDDSSEDV